MRKGKISIEYYSVLKDLIKNIWVVFLCLLIGYMGIYIAEYSIYKPEYTSTATVVVNVKGSSSTTMSSYSISSEMAEVFSNVFSEPAMEKAAAEYLGLENFDGKITAKVLAETNFINISVVSDGPKKSYELLNAVLQVYPSISEEVFQNSVISILKYPSMSSVPSSVGLGSSKTQTLFLIAVISIAAIVAFSVFRDTVKCEKDFKNRVSGKLWGCVPHENKIKTFEDLISKKKKGLLIEGNAFISTRYVESFNRIVAKIEHQKIKDGSKVFVVTSFAENEGKSTISSNIALSLARKGKKVVLMDMDGKKPAIYKLFGCNFEEDSELGMFLSGDATEKNYHLKRYKKTNLFLAINTRPYANSHKWVESGAVKKAIKTLRNMVDYIVIDTAPISVDSSVNEFIKMADKTLLVVKTDVVETTTINDAILTITDVGGNLAGCILNDVHPDIPVAAFTGAGDTGKYSRSKWQLRD